MRCFMNLSCRSVIDDYVLCVCVAVCCAAASLLGAIASFNKDCHYAVAVQHASVYALLQRLDYGVASDEVCCQF